MAYFSHAFQKLLVGLNDGGLVLNAGGDTTAQLTAGELALVDAKTNLTVAAPALSTNPQIYIAQGSYATVDKLGPFHGGYKESVKTKGINPKYVNRFYKVCAAAPQNQIVEVSGLSFECGKTYWLRVDLKGSPALRFLSHNAYTVLDAFSGCCTDDCSATCTGATVDPICVLRTWAVAINEDPIFSQFIQATVEEDGSEVNLGTDANGDPLYTCLTDAEAIAALVNPKLVLTVAYVDTTFGNCSFEPMDHVELQPLQIIASLRDESGNPCTFAGATITEAQEGLQAQGIGETVIREYILSQAYGANNDYKRDPRLREVLDGDTIFTAVSRSARYDRYCILHSVPRFNNPTGTFDNDQYLITLAVPEGTDASAFVAAFESYLSSAGNPIVLEAFGACADSLTTTTTTAAATTTTTAAPTTTTTTAA